MEEPGIAADAAELAPGPIALPRNVEIENNGPDGPLTGTTSGSRESPDRFEVSAQARALLPTTVSRPGNPDRVCRKQMARFGTDVARSHTRRAGRLPRPRRPPH